MEQMSLEALKAHESNLLRELEIQNSEKNNLLQKHRQVLLNSAHLLRLYHQSSKEATEIINQTVKEPEINAPKIETKQNDNVVSEIIRKNGLRLIWDALSNLELLRTSLILDYLRTNQLVQAESLGYFEFQLREKIIQVLSTKQTYDDFVTCTVKALILTSSNHLIEYFKTELANDLHNGSIQIINFYNNLKLLVPQTDETILLFVEKESNFCEYPQLVNIQSSVPKIENEIVELKNSVRNITTSFFTTNLDLLLSRSPIDPEVLKELELEEQLVNNILSKFNELKLKGNTEKLRVDISELFDKLMKSIQTTIRSNSLSIDNTLRNKFVLICENSEISREEFEGILKSFDQTITNKSNIIFTIHKNELSALNSKREIPIPSKLVLASLLCDNLLRGSDNNSLLLKYVKQNIIVKFYEMWLNDISTVFKRLKEENNEIYALMWLSDSFLSLHITNEYKSNALKSLDVDIEMLKRKYSGQSALLTGLSEPETISTPKIHSANISESTRQLLPHFISL